MEEVDSRRVERILRNLLANAIDHSEGRPVKVTMRRGEESLAVTVVDHGMGLKDGEADLVFNRFWRSDPSRERRTGGTGLGLAIAKEDAQLHGGRLEATGEQGVGACFRLTLPRVPGEEVRTSPLPLEVDPELESTADPDLDTAMVTDVDDLPDHEEGTEESQESAELDETVPRDPAADVTYGMYGSDGGDGSDGSDGGDGIDRFDSVDIAAGSAENLGVDLSTFEGLTEEELRIALQEAEDMDDGWEDSDDDGWDDYRDDGWHGTEERDD